MPHAQSQEKNEIVAKILSEIKKKMPEKVATQACEFIRQFYGTTALDDLRERDILDLYGASVSLWNFLEEREQNEIKIRVYNPHFEEHGWQSTHTIVEIIQEDRPFLVDSTCMALNRMGLTIHLITSLGSFKSKRNSEGNLKAVLPFNTPAKDGVISESIMHLEVDRVTDPEFLHRIKSELEEIMHDVWCVVGDWSPMQQRISEAVQHLEGSQKFLTEEEFSESKDFLKWLAADHFTFLGHRYYQLKGNKKQKFLEAEKGTGLGLWRDEHAPELPMHFSEDSLEYRRLTEREPYLYIAKTDILSTVHRPAYMDFIGVKRLNEKGEFIGEDWFFGLFTASAYNTSVQHIPLLRHKVSTTIKETGIAPHSHAGKTLLNILETLPRDDLFQSDIPELLAMSMGIFQMQERQRIRMFARQSRYEPLISCLVYVPRERFSTELRQNMQELLETEFHAKEIMFSTRFSDSVLARIHFVIRIDCQQPMVFDFQEIEQKLVEIGRSWKEELRECLVDFFGEEKGNLLLHRYGEVFPASYRERFNPRAAVYDIQHIEKVFDGNPLEMNFYRPVDEVDGLLRFKIYQLNNSIPLSDILPILENMGLRVMSERPHALKFADGTRAWINDFGMFYDHGAEVDVVAIKEIFQDAFFSVWFNKAENDAFNKLVLRVGLQWREISVLRAYAKFLRQIGITFSQSYIEQALVGNPKITYDLVSLFKLRFDPKIADKSEEIIEELKERIYKDLDAVVSLDEDRILRRYLDLVLATLRTNYFQKNAGSKNPNYKEYLSFKFDPEKIPEMPLPRPMYVVFVYSPRVEGVHLRSAKVARGGIRWSDRREDFYTEVLGLMKAQRVKNSVIVPAGAKGGFVTKLLPVDGDREAILAEGISCYQTFIRGLLDITDNLQNGDIIPPKEVVRYDEDDPYLVVAADKGTATFSNIANEISAQYNFWLGDAFASGGSAGYDHKQMGITARGAWESVKRHFRELDVNIQTTDFTVVGIGDMAGDVFGNGMLLSEHIKLVAAFNHQHIFIDPNPDPAISFKERERLFKLSRSAWSDYDSALLSPGGGVYRRSEKLIRLSPEARQVLGIEQETMIPNDLIRAILKAPIDLLWNGGIGTFVKGSSETHHDVGDRTNDAIRINGDELRCRVVGEGGNLGFTQLGRVEYALNGGRIYNDATDNSAGVDCSDHEVNIKILLDAVVKNGDMTTKQRNALLAEMTDEVGQLVLHNNYHQTLAISLAMVQATVNVEMHGRYIDYLERTGKLDRGLEFLPDTKALMERKLSGHGLTSAGIAVLAAYTKSIVKQEVLDSNVPEDPALSPMIEQEFPIPLRQRFRTQMEQHSLRREIIATQLVNKMINEMGFTFVYRLNDETGAPTSAIVRSYTVARAVFDLDDMWGEIEALDNKVPAQEQLHMLLQFIRLVRRGTRWFLRNRRMRLDIAHEIEFFTPRVRELAEALPHLLVGKELEVYKKLIEHYSKLGVSMSLAKRLAATRGLLSALDVIEASSQFTFEIADLSSLYFTLGDQLELSWLRAQVIERVVESQWEALSREALRDDLDWQQRQLAISVLAHEKGKDKEEKLAHWTEKYQMLIERWNFMLSELRAAPALNFTMFFVATRELLDLTQTSFQSVDVCSIDGDPN